MDRIKEVFATVTTWVNEHRKVSLVIACVLAGFVWGAWSRGLFAAPLPCDLTGQTLTCTIPSSSTTTPPTGGGTTPPPSEFAACPAGAIKITNGFPLNVTNAAATGNGGVVTIKLVIPATASAGYHSAFFSSTYGGAATRTFVLSTSPCDFANPVVDSTGKKPKPLSAQTNSNAFTFSFPVDDSKGLVRGQTYYINIRIDGGCSGSCSFDAIRIS